MKNSIEITLMNDDDGDDEVFTLPARNEVCPDCEGDGYVLNESMRNHAYSAEEFCESFDDEEAEHYFKRGGMYDVQCPTCHGANVVPVIDLGRCTKEQTALVKVYEEQQDEIARSRAEDARYMRMESGGY